MQNASIDPGKDFPETCHATQRHMNMKSLHSLEPHVPSCTSFFWATIVLFAGAGLAIMHAAGGQPVDTEKPGSSPQRPLSVSLIQLIATPNAFDGRYVRVLGFVRIEFEGSAIYFHREDFEQMLTQNGLWLEAIDVAVDRSREEKVNNGYALIEGRFNAGNRGHLGLWSGSLEKITRMEPWAIRKERK